MPHDNVLAELPADRRERILVRARILREMEDLIQEKTSPDTSDVHDASAPDLVSK